MTGGAVTEGGVAADHGQHAARLRNPFPGLRPFGRGEAELFFGRDAHVAALLARLRSQRLLAVVGSSGSGKSSLVLAGVLPRLHRGYTAGGRASWRIAEMRPGSDPLGHLASALQIVKAQDEEQEYRALEEPTLGPSSGTFAQGSVPGAADEAAAGLVRDVLLTQLRRSPQGLVEAARSLELDEDENLLLIVDQFEELFRFQQLLRSANDDAARAFVELLLSASAQTELPIYVMLTMRSDFLGECVQFPGLAEALNEGQYLVPLLNRDQRAEAIRGPIGVAGASISNGLVQRLLNATGVSQDQLPVLQHALMRTFDFGGRRSA